MITTIDSKNLTAAQVSKAVQVLLHLGSSIEDRLGLVNGQHLGLNIEAVSINQLGFTFYMTETCEIVSFDPGCSTATRLLGMYPNGFVFLNNGNVRKRHGKTIPVTEIAESVCSWATTVHKRSR